MRTLVAFIDIKDPYSPTSISGQEQTGPLLSLLRKQNYDRLFLLYPPYHQERNQRTQDALREEHPNLKIEGLECPIFDPTNYAEILNSLRPVVTDIAEKTSDEDLSVLLSSGSAQMQASWLYFSAAQIIDAELIEIELPQPAEGAHAEIKVNNIRGPQKISQPKDWTLEEPTPQLFEDIAHTIGCIGKHPAHQAALDATNAIASQDVSVLLLGETGTGKELFVHLIHRASDRNREPLVSINCAAVPEELTESTFFGHCQGAFPNAHKDQKGKFELANNGTLFLDNIDALSSKAQAKLTRAIEAQAIEPLGSSENKPINVRIIAASNRNLSNEVTQGRFREDLYYRLRAGEIKLPALRERKSDIPMLALHILERINKQRKTPCQFDPRALQALEDHSWAGNVRDLQNVIERAVILTETNRITPEDLHLTHVKTASGSTDEMLPQIGDGFSIDDYISGLRRNLMQHALRRTQGKQSEAARLLGITPQAVHNFLKKNGGKDHFRGSENN